MQDMEDGMLALQSRLLLENAPRSGEAKATWYRRVLAESKLLKHRLLAVARSFSAKLEALTNLAISEAEREANNSLKRQFTKLIDDKQLQGLEPIALYRANYADFTQGTVNGLVDAVFIRYKQEAARFATGRVAFSADAAVTRAELIEHLQKGLRHAPPVIYKNGRAYNYASHAEMQMRTAIQHDVTERIKESALQLGIIFFLATEHADCADDHRAWQGRIYVMQNWKSAINDPALQKVITRYIKQHRVQTVEAVTGKPIYLTTRPNCRHHLTPLATKEVLAQELNKLKDTYNTKSGGKATAENYEALLRQRELERKTRKHRLLYTATGDGKEGQKFALARAQLHLHVKNHPFLKRNYRRETPDKLGQDHGATALS